MIRIALILVLFLTASISYAQTFSEAELDENFKGVVKVTDKTFTIVIAAKDDSKITEIKKYTFTDVDSEKPIKTEEPKVKEKEVTFEAKDQTNSIGKTIQIKLDKLVKATLTVETDKPKEPTVLVLREPDLGPDAEAQTLEVINKHFIVVIEAKSDAPNSKLEEIKKYVFVDVASNKTLKMEAPAVQGKKVTFEAKDVSNEVGSVIQIRLDEKIKAILNVGQVPPEPPKDGTKGEKPPTTSNAETPFPQRQDYIDAIRDHLTGLEGAKGLKFTAGEVLHNTLGGGDTVYIFLDSLLDIAPGTRLPDCSNKKRFYRFFYVVESTSSRTASYVVNALKVESDFVVETGAQGAGVKTLKISPSETFGPFDNGIEITATYKNSKKPADTFTKKIIVETCSFYQVSIVGGFYATTLNDPTNITSGTNSKGVTTLYADHSTGQLALTVMGIFYAKPRKFGYNHKDLEFWEKWSFCFGTQLSKKFFDDVLLGLNYDIAKGFSMAAGVHYGEHKVLAGYERFKYGKDEYLQTFDNSKMNSQWDFGFFAGINVNMGVIGKVWNMVKEQNATKDAAR